MFCAYRSEAIHSHIGCVKWSFVTLGVALTFFRVNVIIVLMSGFVS